MCSCVVFTLVFIVRVPAMVLSSTFSGTLQERMRDIAIFRAN